MLVVSPVGIRATSDERSSLALSVAPMRRIEMMKGMTRGRKQMGSNCVRMVEELVGTPWQTYMWLTQRK